MLLIPSSSSLQIFPDEILLMIFSEADIPALLSLNNTCRKFKRLTNICLEDKFKEQNVGLTLTFGQEYKLRSNITMDFHHVNEKNGNFVFQPKKDHLQLKYYHSPMVKSPKIYRISLNNAKLNRKDTNLLRNSFGFSIKPHEGIYQKTQNVYRTGYLKVPFEFIYSINDIPPSNDTKSRGGERWVTPLSFECSPSFFYPNDVVVHRIFKSIVNYKPIIKKQKTIKNPVVILDATTKQLASFNQESRIQEPQIRIHEKKKLFMVPLVSSRRFNYGARC